MEWCTNCIRGLRSEVKRNHKRAPWSRASTEIVLPPATGGLSSAELVDLAQSHNPETRVAWESACAQATAPGIARSELFPTLPALALACADRREAGFGVGFYRQTIPNLEISIDLNFTIFDFGARRGRIDAESARLLASNFGFNDVHRQLIDDVSEAEQNVQQAAEERLRNGLTPLPDVSEARSATAQAEYDLQAVLGAPASTPESIADTAEAAIPRELEQRPGLQTQFVGVHLAQADQQQLRAALQPSLSMTANPSARSIYVLQQTLPWGHTADLTGSLAFSLCWTVFEGGARRNRLARAGTIYAKRRHRSALRVIELKTRFGAQADLAFRTGDAIQANTRKVHP